MRGKRVHLFGCQPRERITPAHAGKTSDAVKLQRFAGDHPRACGENRTEFPREADVTRITPAHAGKTNAFCCSVCAGSDHPRACGENSGCVKLQRRTNGSPPRMRGKPLKAVLYLHTLRITPAHAGKTYGLLVVASGCADHPRACGENCR